VVGKNVGGDECTVEGETISRKAYDPLRVCKNEREVVLISFFVCMYAGRLVWQCLFMKLER
jgi:hypothetical protein